MTRRVAKLDDIEKKFTLIPRFLHRMCDYNADCEWPFDDLYYAFRDWAKGNGITCFHPKADFEQELQNRDYKIEMRKNELVVIGIELLAQQPRPVSRDGYGRRSTSRSRR